MLFANVALPSFIWHWIIFVLLLPLVVGIEAIVLRRVLNTTFGQSLATAVSANVRSTLVGLPAGWCMAFVGLIPAGALAALLPSAYRDPAYQIVAFTVFTGGAIPNSFSQIAMAAGNLVILIPYYIYTIRFERKVVEARHPKLEPSRVAFAVRSMNRITYAALALIVLGFLLAAIGNYSGQSDEAPSFQKTFEDISGGLRGE